MTSKGQKSVKIDESTFNIQIEGNKLSLSYKDDLIELAEDKDWFFSEMFFGVETNIMDTLRGPGVSDLPDSNGVKAVKLSKNIYLLLLSFYAAPSDARVASGIDIFLIYNSDVKQFWSMSWDLMPQIGRGWGPCRNADMTSYLLQDINDDGQLDIGVLRETITCDFENDAPSKPYFEQQPIRWYVNIKGNLPGPFDYWIPTRTYEAIVPKDYAELFSLSISPVDVMGAGLWKTTDRMNNPAAELTGYRAYRYYSSSNWPK